MYTTPLPVPPFTTNMSQRQAHCTSMHARLLHAFVSHLTDSLIVRAPVKVYKTAALPPPSQPPPPTLTGNLIVASS